jgi:hypothetical protein
MKKQSGRLAALTAIAMTFGALPVHAARQQSPLIGTWVNTIEPPGGAPPSIAVSSFVAGGVVIGTPSEPPPPPLAHVGVVAGTWSDEGEGTYAFTVVAFTYDTSGTLTGTVKFNNKVMLLSDDRYEGISQYQLCDPQLVCPPPTANSAKLTGTRLPLQPVTE